MLQRRRVTRKIARTAEGRNQPQPRPEIQHGKYSLSVFSELEKEGEGPSNNYS